MRTSILFSLSIVLGAILTLLAWTPTQQCTGHVVVAENCVPVGVVTWGMVFTEPESGTIARSEAASEGCQHDGATGHCCKTRPAQTMHTRMIQAALTSAGAAVTSDRYAGDARVI